jgi:hypothetical protein
MRLYILYLKTVKRQYIYSSIEVSEVVLVFERNNAGLKKLPQVLSEQTSGSSAFLNATCLFKDVLNCEENFSFYTFLIWINSKWIRENLLYTLYSPV